MKKTILLRLWRIATISFVCFLSIISYAQAPDWLWAKSAGGANDDEATSIAVDASGNIYVAGYYHSDTIIFGATILTNADSTGNTMNIFLAKYDANGNVLWAKSAGGIGYDLAYSVAVDDSGNAYVAGYFNSPTITFDSTTLTNAGSSNIFLVKYDANGNVLWAKSAGGGSATSIAVDASGNIYVTGYFSNSTLIFGSTTLTNAGYDDIFLAKYDVNGNVLWAKSAGGSYRDDATSIAVDASGITYMAGWFGSPILTFGSTTLTNVDNTGNIADLFLAKYDAGGNVLWAKSAGGTSDDVATSIAVDESGNTYVAGYFQSSTITFDSTTLTIAGTYTNYDDIFLAKYDANGNVLWAKSAGGSYRDDATSIAVDASGRTYVAGWFNSPTITFESTTLTNTGTGGYYDLFLAKYDGNGNVLWAKSADGTNDDKASSVAVDTSGNTYVAGYFKSPNITLGSYTLTNAGYYDIFIAKSDSSTVTGINELSNSLTTSVFPNPATNNLTIEIPQKATIEILNIEGQIIKSISADLPAGKQGENHTTIDISGFASGMYFVKVKS